MADLVSNKRKKEKMKITFVTGNKKKSVSGSSLFMD